VLLIHITSRLNNSICGVYISIETFATINGKKYIGRDAWNKPSYLGGGKAIKAAIEKEDTKKVFYSEFRN
jgi:hypothetical protein